MTDLLVKLFVKNSDDVKNSAVRTAYGRLAGIVGIICNVLLFAGKLAVGTLSGSVSVTADAFNNLSDASSSIISLRGFKLAEMPADREHPYGHGRYEYISGLVVAALVMVIGVELFKTSIEKIFNPEEVSFSIVTAIVLAVSALVKCWMMFFGRKLGKRINSQTLTATAADSRNDVISTCAVLAASVISHFSGVELDGYVGLAVAVFIIINGYGLIKETLDPILGRAPEPERIKAIQDKIMSYEGVLGTHDLIIHDYGPGRQFASVHVEMPAEIDPLISHDLMDNIEKDFWMSESLHMSVHYDPVVTTDPKVCEFRSWITENISRIDNRLSVHDIRMVKGNTHTNVIFDCVLPVDSKMSDNELKEKVSAAVKEKFPDYRCVISIDRGYTTDD